MIQLQLLGSPLVVRDGEVLRGAVAQRHRVALLALLSAAGARGVPRERLLGYLWPESDESRARRLLSESVYVIRKTLGAELLAGDGETLHLDARCVQVDAREMEAALAAGDPARAVELYAGPFLDGFYLDQASEMERWLEAERRRLASMHSQALGELARTAAATGDHVAAAGWWRRAAAAEPFSSTVARELMVALEAAGDPVGALAYARVHEQLLADELGTAPDPETLRVVARLRETAVSRPPISAPPAEPVATAPAAVLVAGDSPRRPSPVRRRRPLAVAALTLLALVAGIGWRSAASTPAPTERELVVLPFEVRGSPDLAYLRDGAPDLLGAELERIGGMRVTRAQVAAEESGDRWIVSGEVVQAGGRVRLLASLREPNARRAAATASVEGEPGDLFALVDRLAAELLVRVDHTSAGRLAEAAGRSTSSLPAFRALVQAEQALRAGDRQRGIVALEEAVREDSAFALAHFRLAVIADAAIRPELAERSVEAAYRHRATLPPRYRMLVEAARAWRTGDPEAAERGFAQVVASYPDEVEGWAGLGEVLYHANPLRGRTLLESVSSWDRVLALDPRHLAALNHRVRLAAMEGDAPRVADLARRIEAEDGGSDQATEARVLAALTGVGRVAPAQLGSGSPASLHFLVWMTAGLMGEPVLAEPIAARLQSSDQPLEARASGLLLAAHLDAAQGRLGDARRRMAQATRLAPVDAMHARALLATLPWTPADPPELADLRRRLERWDAASTPATRATGVLEVVHDEYFPSLRLYLLGRVTAAQRDGVAASGWAAALDRRATAIDSILAAGVRSRVSSTPAPVYDGAHRSPLSGISYQLANRSTVLAQAHERWQHAVALERAGRLREALAWYGTLGEGSRFEFLYVAPAHLRRAEVHAALGEDAEAVRELDHFLRLWRRADPELQPMVRRAAALRARLNG